MIQIYYGKETVPQEIFEIRAEVFSQRLGWNVSVLNNQEIDQFDTAGTVYVTLEHKGIMCGGLRILPTIDQHMMDTDFGKMFSNYQIMRSELIWECTRFCINPNLPKELRHSKIASELLIGLCDVALASGIKYVIGVFDAPMQRIYRRTGLIPTILDKGRSDGLNVYLGLWEANEATTAAAAKKCEINRSSTIPPLPISANHEIYAKRA